MLVHEQRVDMGLLKRSREWDLDLDRYLNRIIPPSPLHRLPTGVSRFLGHRKTQRQDVGNVLGAVWSFVGAFCGLAVVAAVFNNTPSIQRHSPPAFIASFVSCCFISVLIGVATNILTQGASAILEYNAIRSPLGQPRNALLGHTFSALIGVGISKLFQLHSDYEKIKWIAAAIACGISSAVMLLTGTVHPPGGASAVIATIDASAIAMGWYFVGLVLWGATLMMMVGLVLNNIQRQFPVYWWTPLDLKKERKQDEETWPNGRGGLEARETQEQEKYDQPDQTIKITGADVILPDDLSLNAEESKVLEKLRERLRKSVDSENEDEKPRRESLHDSDASSAEFTVVPSRSDRGDSSST